MSLGETNYGKKIYNEKINKHTDWGGDSSTENLPVSGLRVQEFIKDTLDSKIGFLYYDPTNNRYLAFADEESKDDYLKDTDKRELILGIFDAPFNYSAEINLKTDTYNAVALGSTENYLIFTSNIKNKNGQSTGENVLCTYTIKRGATKQVIQQQYNSDKEVLFITDKYLLEGTNNITIAIQGKDSLAATSVSIEYQVVELSLNVEFSLGYVKPANTTTIEIPFTVQGQGTKVVEWFIGGVQIEADEEVDEVTTFSVSRTRLITLPMLHYTLAQIHHLQARAYTVINEEKFYSDIAYIEFREKCKTDDYSSPHTAIKTTIPSKYGIVIKDGLNSLVGGDIIPKRLTTLYNCVQYVPYTLEVYHYFTSDYQDHSSASVLLNQEQIATIGKNEHKYVTFVPKISGTNKLTLQSVEESATYKIEYIFEVAPSSMKITEIKDSLELDFNAVTRSNSDSNKESFTYNKYTGTFTGFGWNAYSGWVDKALYINNGTSFGINLAPYLNNPILTGKTIEIDFATTNVRNDDAVICDLTQNGVGLKLMATRATLSSRNGTSIDLSYNQNEFNRLSFVINKSEKAVNKCTSFIYVNGIVSRGTSWVEYDSYQSDRTLLFTGTKEAEIEIKSIRIYNKALTSDQELK